MRITIQCQPGAVDFNALLLYKIYTIMLRLGQILTVNLEHGDQWRRELDCGCKVLGQWPVRLRVEATCDDGC